MPVMEEPLSRVAQYVHRIVFGEGPIPEKPLSRIEWLLAYAIEKGISGIKEGYYYNGQFYKDEEHTELLEPAEGNLYYDKNGKKIYLYDGTNYVEVGVGGNKPYLSLNRLSRYLYNVTFLEVPDYIDINTDYGACSSYVKDGKLYRNLDWKYDNGATFKINLPNIEGTAFIDGLTDTDLDDNLIGQLPYHMVDGVNENGIMVSTHVLFNDFEYANDGNTPLGTLPYLVLSRVKSMATIEADLADILDDLKPSAGMIAAEYLIQLLVTDGVTTCVIYPTNDGTYEIINATANPKLTNFRWVADADVVRTNLQTRPTGVERWNAMPTDLKNLRYTKCYEAPNRLSEFIGIDETTKDSTDEELEAIYDEARPIYLNRERDGETWQTMHSAVYGQNGLEHLWIQENWDKDYITTGADSWGEIKNKPFESIGSGFHVDEDGVLSAEAIVETFVFKGYVSAIEPTGTIKADALWYQSAAMPTTFPIQVKTYDGTAWGTDTTNYTPESLEMWANLGDGHGYYWFGNDWNIIDVNVEYDNVTIGVNATGQLEVKTAYRLPASTTSDDGKFLRNVNGAAAWVAVPNAENNSF